MTKKEEGRKASSIKKQKQTKKGSHSWLLTLRNEVKEL